MDTNDKSAPAPAPEPAEEAGESKGKIEFKAPPGFAIPQGGEGGKPFDVVCTFEARENGELCLVKIGDSDAPGYGKNADKGEPEKAPDYKGMGQNMASAMSEFGKS